MKEGELREILDQSGLDPTRSSGSVNVLVDLRVPKPDQFLIADLERVGLVVNRIVGSTVLGSIDAAKMSELHATSMSGRSSLLGCSGITLRRISNILTQHLFVNR